MSTTQHDQLIAFAYAKCMENTCRKKKHCSIILHKRKIVACGINRMKTHPLAVKHGYRFGEVHSELDAFLKCDIREDIELWNFRFNKQGEMKISRPCKHCMPWCSKIFDKIYYTTDKGIVALNTTISCG